ncbi:hypothetical protein D3C78_1715220 [compost metagenome]
MLTRHEVYNDTVAFCEQLEQEGRAVIIRPAHSLNSFEKDIGTLRATCQHGYDLAMDKMEDIRSLFQ